MIAQESHPFPGDSLKNEHCSERRMVAVKKILSLLLCVSVIATLALGMTGCGKQEESSGGRHVVVTYFYGEELPKDIDLVEAAVNEYLKELNTDLTMEFYPISVYSQNYSTILMTDPIDLMCVAFGSSPIYYAQMEMIQTITDEEVQEFCPNILEMNDEFDMMVRNSQGEIVGISTRELGIYNGGAYVIRKSDLDAIGMGEQYADGTAVTLSELETIFGKLKEQFPESYPIVSKMDESSYAVSVDPLGNNKFASGVLDFSINGTESTQIVNYYESEAYVSFCKFMANCYANGWIDPEAETSTVTKNAAFINGVARGVLLEGLPSLRDDFATQVGEECVRLQILTPTYVPQRAEAITWAVAGPSENKQAALEFLDLFWSDVKLMNMIQWGIEGTHFEIVDAENGIIRYADGLTAETSGFRMGGGFYGDKRYIYVYESTVDTYEEQVAAKQEERAAMEAAAQNPSPAGNFIYDSSAHDVTIKNIEAVIDRYANIMALGGYTDEVYAEFIAALKAADIGAVIADKQAQLDAYLAEING